MSDRDLHDAIRIICQLAETHHLRVHEDGKWTECDQRTCRLAHGFVLRVRG